MALTNNFGNSDAVRQAYINFLGRAPSQDEINWHLANSSSLAEIQNNISSSPEAQQRKQSTPTFSAASPQTATASKIATATPASFTPQQQARQAEIDAWVKNSEPVEYQNLYRALQSGQAKVQTVEVPEYSYYGP